jgi:hypothetical protein
VIASMNIYSLPGLLRNLVEKNDNATKLRKKLQSHRDLMNPALVVSTVHFETVLVYSHVKAVRLEVGWPTDRRGLAHCQLCNCLRALFR